MLKLLSNATTISASGMRLLLPLQQVQNLVPVATMKAWHPHSKSRTFKSNKHFIPKWRKMRGLKVIKIELPEFYKDQKEYTDMTQEEMRQKMKEMGIQPVPEWNEKAIDLSSTSEVFEPYIPPEGDGKMSIITAGGVKQTGLRLTKKTKSWRTFRKIRQYDEDFDDHEFAQSALEIYKQFHNTLASLTGIDEDDELEILLNYVTERAYPEVIDNLQNKQMKWQFVEALDPPRVVHARHADIMSYMYGQLTIRFHTKQVLAVYDRFGRLCHGNPYVAKDVLEYVVFEKRISDLYGHWRIHKKIIPDWLKDQSEGLRTVRMPKEPEPEPTAEAAASPVTTAEGSSPQVATATA